MYIVNEENDKIYVTSKKDLIDILNKKGINVDYACNIFEHSYMLADLGIDTVESKYDVDKVLHLMKEFFEASGDSEISNKIGRIIDLMTNYDLSDHRLVNSGNDIVVEFTVHYIDFNKIIEEYSDVLKDALFELSTYTYVIDVKIPIVPAKLIPTGKFNMFIKELKDSFNKA